MLQTDNPSLHLYVVSTHQYTIRFDLPPNINHIRAWKIWSIDGTSQDII